MVYSHSLHVFIISWRRRTLIQTAYKCAVVLIWWLIWLLICAIALSFPCGVYCKHFLRGTEITQFCGRSLYLTLYLRMWCLLHVQNCLSGHHRALWSLWELCIICAFAGCRAEKKKKEKKIWVDDEMRWSSMWKFPHRCVNEKKKKKKDVGSKCKFRQKKLLILY